MQLETDNLKKKLCLYLRGVCLWRNLLCAEDMLGWVILRM